MLPVFMILLCKIYFMRASARQRKYRIKELYRQTEARLWRAFRVPPGHRAHIVCAISCRILASPKQAGQACRSRPRKIPRKSRGVYLTFTPLPRDTCPEPRPPCGREGVISKSFFGTFGESKGDSVPLRSGREAAYSMTRAICIVRYSSSFRPAWNPFSCST